METMTTFTIKAVMPETPAGSTWFMAVTPKTKLSKPMPQAHPYAAARHLVPTGELRRLIHAPNKKNAPMTTSSKYAVGTSHHVPHRRRVSPNGMTTPATHASRRLNWYMSPVRA
jgi:hypothetical protein